MSLFKSKQRIADHGEVFTPGWMVEAMLELVKGETERIAALDIAGNWRIASSSLTEYIASALRKQNVKVFEKTFSDSSSLAQLLQEVPDLRLSVEGDLFQPGSMGRILQKALLVERAKYEGRVVPIRPPASGDA